MPRSVYAAVPGRNKFRPSQATPAANFVLAGDFTAQKFLGSMEGAVLAGKLAAELIADRAAGRPTAPFKPAAPRVPEDPHGGPSDELLGLAEYEERDPVGVRGDYPIAFGGGQQGSGVGTHV